MENFYIYSIQLTNKKSNIGYDPAFEELIEMIFNRHNDVFDYSFDVCIDGYYKSETINKIVDYIVREACRQGYYQLPIYRELYKVFLNRNISLIKSVITMIETSLDILFSEENEIDFKVSLTLKRGKEISTMIDTDEFGTFFNPGAYDKLTKYKKRQFKLNENVSPAMVVMYVYPRLLKKLAEIGMIDDYDEAKRILSDCMIQYAL